MTTQYMERTEEQIKVDAAVLARVKKGLKWLEETHGPGWEDKIDMRKLNLRSGTFCVLGQVYAEKAEASSDYNETTGFVWAYRNMLDRSNVRTQQLGFNLGSRPSQDKWDELTEAWRIVLHDHLNDLV